MRAHRVLACGLAVVASASLVIACVDLFHSTDFATLCELDASACAAQDVSVDAAPTFDANDGAIQFPADFCLANHVEARARAEHACGWLAACEGSLGDNALGTCMIHALLAYDCAANPNRPVRGDLHTYWDRLWRVTSCADVDAIVEPAGKHPCASSATDFVQCGAAAADASANAESLIACSASSTQKPPVAIESCIASGRTCAIGGATATCSGSSPAKCASGNGCSQSHLVDCDPDGGTIDFGVDCQYFGDGTCTSGACAASGDGGGCPVTTDLTCTSNRASGCPSGRPEVVDCTVLLGSSACSPFAEGRAWDVSRGCYAGTCTAIDACQSGSVSTCFRGATFTLDCAALGLGKCALTTLPDDAGTHAACTPP